MLGDFSIGLYRIDGRGSNEDMVLLGSGTLVRIDQVHAILTAHHVVEILPTDGTLGVLTTPHPHRKAIDTQGIEYLKISRGTVDADGPDIGAIVLSPSAAATLAAEKSFFNLSLHQEEALRNPPARNIGVWFMHGFVAEMTREEPGSAGFARLKKFGIFTGAGGPNEDATTSGDHDYYNLPVTPTCRETTPRDYGGISGGGLWQVPLQQEPDGDITPIRPLLSGVIFYQDRDPHGVLALKSHGRKSVYSVAYDAIIQGKS